MKSMLRSTHLSLALLGALAAACPARPAWAVDTEPAAAAGDPLGAARQHIVAKSWPAALTELRRANATGLADWHNLMGYTLRKQAAPDLGAAKACYEAALKMDPMHRGALEYDGELALMTGDLARAERHLGTLARACPGGCEARADLQREIQRFKSNGNRYVVAP